MKQSDTKNKLLNTAEHLFAKQGYQGTSLRCITGKAKVNLASVSYHFGSKEKLLKAVFKRRLVPLNQKRTLLITKVLEEADKQGSPPQVKDVLRAFMEPTIKFRDSEPRARHFVKLVGRSFTAADKTVHKTFHSLIGPMFNTLYGALRKALPNLPEEVLVVRLHLTLGAMAFAMLKCDEMPQSDQINCSGGISTDFLLDVLIPYVTAGMEAP